MIHRKFSTLSKVGLVTMMVASVLPLAGCWDRREINDIAFVIAAAADKADNGIRVTEQIPLPGSTQVGSAGGGGGTSSSKSYYVDSGVGSTLRAANDDLQSSMSRQQYFSHMRVFVVGEELAKSGISSILDVDARVPQNRLTTYFLVAEGNAADTLSVKAPLEKFPGELIRELAAQSMKVPRRIKQVVEGIIVDGIDPIAPAIAVTETKPGSTGDPESTVKMTGLAIFHKDHLLGFLREEDARGVLWAMNQANKPTINISAPRGAGKLSVFIPSNSVSILPHITKQGVSFRIDVKAKGSLLENESGFEEGSDRNVSKIEQATEAAIQLTIERGVKQLQQMGSDPVGFGASIYRINPAYWKKIKPAWETIYKTIPVKVRVQVQLDNTGNLVLPLAKEKEELTK